MTRQILETEQKALEINLDDRVYGAFAEIGAGQEVARHFFQVGAAAGTIAKTMSAYDKTVSDDIYGVEDKGRYVCESRLYKMLDHEYALMERRLRSLRQEHTFFAFADTVSAINYQRTIKGNGWLGLRFQLDAASPPNDLVLHVRLLDNDNRQQQQAVGILGVNMIYACFRYYNDPEILIISLLDNLKDRVAIDMARLTGHDFEYLDNRLICLWLVKNNLSQVAIFGPNGKPLQAGEFLYKKSVLIARGSYRPTTLVQQDMIQNGYRQFQQSEDVDPNMTYFLVEITLDNLMASGTLCIQDFLDRAEMLGALNQTVIISSCVQHKKLISYFTEYKVQKIGLAMGARKLKNIINETCQQNQNNLLSAFGELFPKNVRFFVYPARESETGSLLTAQNLSVPSDIHFLYKFLLENNYIVDIQNFDPTVLHIFHKYVLKMIHQGDLNWVSQVPLKVEEVIKAKNLFGYQPQVLD